jgi:hypothetical protein
MNPTREELLFPLAHAAGLNSLIWVGISASDNLQECLGLSNGVI